MTQDNLQARLKHFAINEIIPLPQQGSWPPSRHLLDKPSAYALEMALAIGKPLLVKGEPGMGKSQLARAAATKLGRVLISHVVNINCEGQDLLWHYDPVARLNDAQAIHNANDKHKQMVKILHPKHYLNPGVLWWAFNWQSANSQYKTCQHKIYRPDNAQNCDPNNGVVLLIDEIDKADPSLPNTLLEALGNGGFEVPLINQTVRQNKHNDCPKPLVIITTNEERELPPAFMRRCLVLKLTIDDEKIEPWLIERGNVHFKTQLDAKIISSAAELLKKERHAAELAGTVKSGQAEYLDLFNALYELTKDQKDPQKRKQEQESWLAEINQFALCKAE